MKYADPQLRQILAAEYALGTMSGRVRRRFERLLRGEDHRAMLDEVRWWERRLAAFGLRVPPQAPPPLVWAKIDRQINATRGAAYFGRVREVNFWRVVALAASVAALMLGVQLLQLVNQPPQVIAVPQIVPVQPTAYVAMLQPGGDLKYLVAMLPARGLIKVSVSGEKSPASAEQSLELWLLDDAGTPHSLGVMPQQGEAQMKLPANLPKPAKMMLAISLEPQGGSPTGLPTGPVLTARAAVQLL